MKDTKKYLPLILLIVLFEGVSAAIGINTAPNGDPWYEALAKSSLTPPDWVFGVVWPSLYLLMAVSVWLIWQSRSKTSAILALIVFAIHMLLNWSWNFIFFEFHMLFAAFCLIAVILAFLSLLIVWFFSIRTTAGLLLLPYLAWVSFATYLSGFIWIAN